MALQRKAIGAESILPFYDPSVRKKLPEFSVTYSALLFVSKVKNGDDPQDKMTDDLEIAAGDVTREYADDGFHKDCKYS